MSDSDRYLDAIVATDKGWNSIRFENIFSETKVLKPYGNSPCGKISCLVPKYSDSERRNAAQSAIESILEDRKRFQAMMEKHMHEKK